MPGNKFYVHHTGTNISAGGYATAQTGPILNLGVANLYQSIKDAQQLGGATKGDLICASHEHDFDHVDSVYYTGYFSGEVFLTIASVDHNAIENEKPGATERASSSSGDMYFRYYVKFRGVNFYPGRYPRYQSSLTTAIFEGCEFFVDEKFYCGGNTVSFIFKRCVFNVTGYIIALFEVTNDGYLRMEDSKILSDSGGVNYLIQANTTGCTVDIRRSDLSACFGKLYYAYNQPLSVKVRLIVDACVINPAMVITPNIDSFRDPTCYIRLTRSGPAGENNLGQLLDISGRGTSEDDTGIVRVGSKELTGIAAPLSIKVVTLTYANVGYPYAFSIPVGVVDLTQAATQKLRMFFISTDTITTHDLGINVGFSEYANPDVFLRAGIDLALISGPEYPTDAVSAWEDLGTPVAGFNLYQADIDLSAAGGGVGYLELDIEYAKPDSTVYFSTDVETMAA